MNTDFDHDTDFNLPYPSWLHCYIPSEEPEYEDLDENGMPVEDVERDWDTVDDLIIPPQLDEDEELEDDWEDDDFG